MLLAEVIREAMKARGLTQGQLGDVAGVKQQTIQKLIAKGEGSDHLLQRVADALGISFQELRSARTRTAIANELATPTQTLPQPLANTGPRATLIRSPETFRSIPILGYAAGAPFGNGHLIMDGVKGYIPCPPTPAHLDGVFAVYVSGESMSPRFEPGTLVIVHPLEDPRRGDSVVAQIEDPVTGELTGYIKEYVGVRDGKLILKQFNPLEELQFDVESVKELNKVVVAML